MKKITLLLLFFSSIAAADGQYACISGHSAGLNWEKGAWVTSKFKTENSLISIKSNGEILEQKDAGSDVGSVFKCNKSTSGKSRYLNCFTTYGGHLVFNESTMQGASSSILGAVSGDSSYKDSLYVTTITCQKF